MYACYICYNNERTIGRSLESILPHVEKVVIVDGAFKNYPHKVPWSTDRTKEVAEEICGDKLIWVGCDKPWSQIMKRNQYLEYVPNDELFIIMDSDDVLDGDPTAFNQINESYLCVGVKCIKFYPKWKGSFFHIPEEAWLNLEWEKAGGVTCRIYRKQEDMEYRNHHSTVFVGRRTVSRYQHILDNIVLRSIGGKSWMEYMSDIIYRLERPSAITGRRTAVLQRYTGGKEPGEELIEIKNQILQRLGCEPVPKPIVMPIIVPKPIPLEDKRIKISENINPIVEKWSKNIELNKSLAMPWHTGLPYNWWQGMTSRRFLDELPKHIGKEESW